MAPKKKAKAKAKPKAKKNLPKPAKGTKKKRLMSGFRNAQKQLEALEKESY